MSVPPGGWQAPPPGWQPGWPQPAPPQKGGGLKWLLIAVAVLLVIGISVGATLLFTRGGGGSPTATSAAPSDVASANDTGPVAIITDEPTCTAFNAINNGLADVQSNGWGAERSLLGSVSQWTPEQRTHVEAVAKSLRNAADQTVALAMQTPHRLVRELYEQFIAYARAYVASTPNYTPQDDGLATANVNANNALIGICNTITYGSTSRSLDLDAAPAPTHTPVLGDPSDPKRFISSSDASCMDWIRRSDDFSAATSDWAKLDSSVPASQWTPERRATEQAVQPLLSTYASQLEAAGLKSNNPTLEDFAVASALYIRAYLSVGDSYTSADGWLSAVAFRISNLVEGACHAATGK